MARDSTRGTIEFIRNLQSDLVLEEDLLGGALPCHCDVLISRLESFMEKQIVNLKKQIDEIMGFLTTDAEREMSRKMQSDLENLQLVITNLKHPNALFGDARDDPLGCFCHFHDTRTKSYYAVVADYITLKNNVYTLVNAKLNEQVREEGV